jgi:dolichol-phosphate mannosyltransferase
VLKDYLVKRNLTPLAPDDYRISVVMPVFSETDTVRIVVEWLHANLAERLHEIIIVISPRSSKESYAICEEMSHLDSRVQLCVQQVNPGVGNAFREGYARATGNVILSMDSDNEMELAAIPKMLDKLAQQNLAVVVGSRWLRGGGFVGYSPAKRVLNWGFQQLFRVLFLTRCTDLTYGFKVLRAEVIHGIGWEATLSEIGCETTMKPLRAGFAVGEVPSTWTARTQGRSTNNFWRNFRYVHMALRVLWHGVSVSEGGRETASVAAFLPARREKIT